MPTPVLQHEQLHTEGSNFAAADLANEVVGAERLNPFEIDQVESEGQISVSVVTRLGHTGMSKSAELHDGQSGPNYARRLPGLETKKFDPDKAHLRLELFSGHNVFMTSLDNFDVGSSTAKHSLPTEFRMFSDRRERVDKVFEVIHGDIASTAKADAESKAKGLDIDYALFNSISYFIDKDPRGKEIISDMGLDGIALEDMTAKESISLIGYLMYELTNYDDGAVMLGQGNSPADTMNSLQIIQNGLVATGKADVKPLGICHNFADVGQAVFNSFKSRNPKLTNVYCNNATGYAGATISKLRKQGEAWKGHAWLDFIAVGPRGDMAITTVDPTWSTRSGRGLRRYDMTDLRIGTHTRSILAMEKTNYVSRKTRNLDRVLKFYEDQVDSRATLLKNMFSNGQNGRLDSIDRNDPVFNSAMYFAVDCIISASAFGGSTFYTSENPLTRTIMSLVHQAAKDPDIIFSPTEYHAVNTGLSMYEKYEGVSDAFRAKIAKTKSDLSDRYAIYSQALDYTIIYGMNEGA